MKLPKIFKTKGSWVGAAILGAFPLIYVTISSNDAIPGLLKQIAGYLSYPSMFFLFMFGEQIPLRLVLPLFVGIGIVLGFLVGYIIELLWRKYK